MKPVFFPAWVCLGVLALALPALAWAEPTLLDEVIAGVNGQAITRSQVEQETRFQLARSGMYWAGKLTPTLLERVARRTVAEELLWQEMERTASTRRQDLDPEALLLEFRMRFAEDEQFLRFLRLCRMDRESLRLLLERKARLEAFIQQRLGVLSQVSQEELDDELRSTGPIRFTDEKEKRAWMKATRERKQREKSDSELKRWLQNLKRRGHVVRLVRFDPELPEESW